MNIALLTTTLSGGAGIAAERSGEALARSSAEVTVIGPRVTKKRYTSKALTLVQSQVVQNSSELITTFSLNKLDTEDLERFDVIHLHAFYNLISTSSISDLAREKPVFITMHDQRISTGGCHYSGNCLGFKSSCSRCPKVNPIFRTFVEKEKSTVNLLLSNSNVYLVSPSKWLADQVEKASPFKLGNPILVVPNPVPKQIELDKTKIRNEMNLFSKTVIGFISMIPENPNKGLSQLLTSLKHSDANIRQKVVLLIVGGRNTPEIPSSIKYRHVTQDEFSSVSNIYSAIDILAVPSLQDNSPNVIAEALCNNVKIIGSSFGGIPELLQQFNQSIVDVNDHQSFKEEIKRLVENAFEPINVSTEAKNFFSYENHATTLLKAYENAINK